MAAIGIHARLQHLISFFASLPALPLPLHARDSDDDYAACSFYRCVYDRPRHRALVEKVGKG